MNSHLHLWLARDRCEELLREAARARLVGRLRRVREGGEPSIGRTVGVREKTEVRLGRDDDAAQISRLLDLRGVPSWVALEERFLVAERGGRIVAVARFRQDGQWLYLGFFATNPRTDEGSLAACLNSGARAVARELGLRGVRTTRPTPPRQASEKGAGIGGGK
jgi:hypothetical protein